MLESKIEKELLEASALKPKKKEERQAYLTRLMRAVAALKDPEWEALSGESQDWVNGAAEFHKAGDEIVDFADYVEEDYNPRPSDEPVDEEEEAPVVAKGKNGKEPKAEKEKPAKEVAKAPVNANPGRKVSACHTIKKMVVQNPTITVAELSEQLKDQGLKVSDVTISTLRSDLRDTLRVLNELEIATFVL